MNLFFEKEIGIVPWKEFFNRYNISLWNTIHFSQEHVGTYCEQFVILLKKYYFLEISI